MIKTFCDKCSKEIPEYEAYTLFIEAPEIKAWGDEYVYDRRGYQICKDCINKVAGFITGK